MKRREFFKFLAVAPVIGATGLLALTEDEEVLAGTSEVGLVYNKRTGELIMRNKEDQSGTKMVLPDHSYPVNLASNRSNFVLTTPGKI